MPVSALPVQVASITVPVGVDDNLTSDSVPTAFVIELEAPVSWNLTGIVLPSLKLDVPSALIGWRTPDHASWTTT